MARRISHVADRALHVLEPSGAPQIPVGSLVWAAWLADPATRSFSFRGSSGTFTVLEERCSSRDGYWTAYRKRGGKLRNVYLGKPPLASFVVPEGSIVDSLLNFLIQVVILMLTFSLAEEIGIRGYLLPKLLSLGRTRALASRSWI